MGLSQAFSVLWAPVKTFRQLAEKPSWIVPMILLVLAGISLSLIISPKLDYRELMTSQLEQQGREVSEEQLDTIVGTYEKFGSVIGGLMAVVSTAGFLLVALLLWGGGRLLGSSISFVQSLSVFVHALMPRFVMALLTLPIVASADRLDAEQAQSGSFLASNLSFLAPEGASPVLMTLFSSLDFFSVWVVVLMTLGMAVVGKLSTAKAAGISVGLWLFWILIKVGLAMLGSMAGGG